MVFFILILMLCLRELVVINLYITNVTKLVCKMFSLFFEDRVNFKSQILFISGKKMY